MPSLQLHQLRVASVAKMIGESLLVPIDNDTVVTACLFHDMGNIIKSDLSIFPEFCEPEGIDYWQSVKTSFIKKYGTNEHTAIFTIAKEIGISEEALSCIAHIGFSKFEQVAQSECYEFKIATYADARVGPHGVLTLDERLAESKKRYARSLFTDSSDRYHRLIASAHTIETQLFSHANITQTNITDSAIANTISLLANWSLKTTTKS